MSGTSTEGMTTEESKIERIVQTERTALERTLLEGTNTCEVAETGEQEEEQKDEN